MIGSSFGHYGSDVLNPNPHRRGDFAHNPEPRPVEARRGLIARDVDTGFVGEIVCVGKVASQWQVELEGRKDVCRSFPLDRGLWIDGCPTELVRPQAKAPAGRVRITSDSFHVSARAHTARGSRTRVESKHDAELVAKIWGADLALEGAVVEELRGVDRLEECLAEFSPSPARRAGVLIDHLVRGSKEQRIAERFSAAPDVLILGHPYVDVWQAVRPAVLRLCERPEVSHGEDTKVGMLKRLRWPHVGTEGVGLGWARILEKVTTYKDLEPSLLGRIEELTDSVTEGSVK